jgi:hypothetical protein
MEGGGVGRGVDAESDWDSDWLSAESDLVDDLRELGSLADNPRALVNSTGPWLTSSELWSVASLLTLCSEAPGGVEEGSGSRCGAGARVDVRSDTAYLDDA